MAGECARGPLGTITHQPLVDAGTLALVLSPSVGPCRADEDRQAFETAVDLIQAELANTGATGVVDAAARARYDRAARAFRDEIYVRVRSGRLTWRQAAEEAHGLRDDLLQLLRRRSTPVGRAWAEWLKPQGRSLNELIARKTIELFGAQADFNRLTPAQRNRVYAAIVESAGKSNPRITAIMRKVSPAARGLLVLSLGISVYSIATADDMLAEAKHEGSVTGAGIAGGMAGGALAGLMCGPGAPVCVTIGAFVGGAAAAMGVDLLWDR